MQKYATINNLKIRKSGKGITKVKLLQSILKNITTTIPNKTTLVTTKTKNATNEGKINKLKEYSTTNAINDWPINTKESEQWRTKECNTFEGKQTKTVSTKKYTMIFSRFPF